eukprot:ctg_63.g18
MLGMLFFGAVGDRMGRRFGGIATMAVMATGAAVMTFVYSPSISDMFIVISSFFGVLGLGVGGEYPIAASNAAEKRNEEAEGEASAAVANGSNGQTRSSESTPPISGKTPSPPLSTTLASQRGRTVTVVFSMQHAQLQQLEQRRDGLFHYRAEFCLARRVPGGFSVAGGGAHLSSAVLARERGVCEGGGAACRAAAPPADPGGQSALRLRSYLPALRVAFDRHRRHLVHERCDPVRQQALLGTDLQRHQSQRELADAERLGSAQQCGVAGGLLRGGGGDRSTLVRPPPPPVVRLHHDRGVLRDAGRDVRPVGEQQPRRPDRPVHTGIVLLPSGSECGDLRKRRRAVSQ